MTHSLLPPRKQLQFGLLIATIAITICHSAIAQNASPKDVGRSDLPQREIALSFDDAPRPGGRLLSGDARTAKLIEALDRADVKGAGFFILTNNISTIEGGAERTRAYQRAGHFLANHSHTHPSLNKTDADAFLADVDMAAEILSDFDNTLDLFRYPYLREGDTWTKHVAVRDGLIDRGLRNAYVTVDNYDWYLQAMVDEALEAGHVLNHSVLGETYVELLVDAVEFYDALAQRTLGRSPRHVLLLHENDLAALFVDDLVDRLRELGWNIIPITEAYEDEMAESVPITLLHNQGRVAALAHAAGLHVQELTHVAEDEDHLRMLFEERGLLPKAASAPDD